jgi:hypothetical protein
MTDQYPITPPPELLDQWAEEYWGEGNDGIAAGEKHIATQAARWGWDQRSATVPAELQQARDEELEACCDHIRDYQWGFVDRPDGTTMHRAVDLQKARRPKPPSLKEQALRLVSDYGVPFYRYTAEQTDIIRRALELLDD